MKIISIRKEVTVLICFIIFTSTLFTYMVGRASKIREMREAKEFSEISSIKSDIQNIYTQMILIHQEIGEHEVRIHKLEPESPIIKTYLKNMKILTETINMHRRELRKCQKKEQ